MNIECGSIRVHELQTTVLISFTKLIFRITISLSIFSLFLSSLLLFTLSYPYEIFVKATVSHECFLWMQVLEEMLSDY